MAAVDTRRTGDVQHGRRMLFIWLAASAVATPIAAFVIGPLIPPGNGSEQAKSQVFDNQVLIAVSAPVVMFVLVMLAYTLIVFRQRDAVAQGLPVRGDSRLQLFWIVITSVTVLALAGFGTYELVKDGSGGGQGPSATFLPSGHSKAMDVQVIGQQWEFTYRYPTFGGLETPHLYLPANTLIRLHVTSLDAIHSFWAINLGVKADANPGVDNVVYVQTKNPLKLQIRCAELCGLWHGYMFDSAGRVVSQSDFASWIKQQRAALAPSFRYLPAYATVYHPDPPQRAG